MDLIDMSRQFKQQRRRRIQGRWTCRQQRPGGWVSSQCNYFIVREGYRQQFWNVALRLPNHHDLDHQAAVAKIYPGLKRHMKAYQKKHHRFSIRLPRYGPKTKLESSFKELQEGITPTPVRQRMANIWIFNATWKLIDHCAILRRTGKLTQRGEWAMGRQIKALLKVDRQPRMSLQRWRATWRMETQKKPGGVSKDGTVRWRTNHLNPTTTP